MQRRKTVNDYTVSLTQNGRMDDALVKYGKTHATYDQALNGLPPSMTWLNHGEFAAKFGCDVALINLNIASIKSKKGDVGVVINSYGTGCLPSTWNGSCIGSALSVTLPP